MRYLFLSALLAALPMFSRADDGVALLLNNGSEVTFTFAERPCIATTDVITITTPGGTSVEYAYDDVQRISWADVVPSGIGKAVAAAKGNLRFAFTDGGIDVYGLPEGATVQAYTTDGTCVAKAKATAHGTTTHLELPGGQKLLLLGTSTGVSCKVVRK